MNDHDNGVPDARQRSVPLPEAFRFWTTEKLRNGDTDQFGHVNNAVMATLFEAGRMEIFSDPGITRLMDGANLAVVRLLMNFHRELFYPGDVRIGSSVQKVGNTSFEVTQGLFDASGCVASAAATCVLFDPVQGRAHSIAPALRAYLLAPWSENADSV